MLARFQRNGGLAATLDVVTIRTDGAARIDNRHGGAGRRLKDFRLRSATLRRIRTLLARLPRRLPATGPGRRLGATYRLSYRGRILTAVEGAIPRVARAPFAALEAVLDETVPELDQRSTPRIG